MYMYVRNTYTLQKQNFYINKKKLQQKVFFNKNFKIYILFKLAVLFYPFPEFANNLIKLNMYVCTYIHVYRLNMLKTANNQNFVKQLFTEQNVETFFHPTKRNMFLTHYRPLSNWQNNCLPNTVFVWIYSTGVATPILHILMKRQSLFQRT